MPEKSTIIDMRKNMVGGAGYRSRYLSHAKRALYHLSYAPWLKIRQQTIITCLNNLFTLCQSAFDANEWNQIKTAKKYQHLWLWFNTSYKSGGRSDGRAPALHARGTGIDTRRLQPNIFFSIFTYCRQT